MAIYSEFSHTKWWFSIVMLVYQAGYEQKSATTHGALSQTLGFFTGISSGKMIEAGPMQDLRTWGFNHKKMWPVLAIKHGGLMVVYWWFNDGLMGFNGNIPSGNLLHSELERSTMLLMGKSTISMAIFNSKLLVYQRVSIWDLTNHLGLWKDCEKMKWTGEQFVWASTKRIKKGYIVISYAWDFGVPYV